MGNRNRGRERWELEAAAGKRAAGLTYMVGIGGPTVAEVKARQRLIPVDTRDLTGRIMGDPLPGDTRRRAHGSAATNSRASAEGRANGAQE